ncbi:MAG: SMP-30/gluconolactonase/LRE family protein [Flavobacteriaceae bacterium]
MRYINNQFIYLLFGFAIVLSLAGCTQTTEVYKVDADRTLIPEGIAYDSREDIFYLSSIYHDKIIAFDPETGKTRDLISSGQFGYKHGIGMEIKDGLLFALSSAKTREGSNSTLIVYDLDEDKFLRSYTLNDTIDHFMNDLAISNDLKIYITDTDRHLVYQLEYPDGEIIEYLSDPTLQYPNGIAISDDSQFLYVDSWTDGIRVVDLEKNEVINRSYAGTSLKVAVDGLKYYKGALYGIRNDDRDKSLHGLLKIGLAKDKSLIDTIMPLLIDHPVMDIPTTLSVANGTAYVLANSQLDRLDQENHTIRHMDSLTPTYIIKHKL